MSALENGGIEQRKVSSPEMYGFPNNRKRKLRQEYDSLDPKARVKFEPSSVNIRAYV